MANYLYHLLAGHPPHRRGVSGKAIAPIVALVLGAGVVVFHPARPLYMQQRAVDVTVDDGIAPSQ